jgi:hypothetical protein
MQGGTRIADGYSEASVLTFVSILPGRVLVLVLARSPRLQTSLTTFVLPWRCCRGNACW